jgi:hypothetical protein
VDGVLVVGAGSLWPFFSFFSFLEPPGSLTNLGWLVRPTMYALNSCTKFPSVFPSHVLNHNSPLSPMGGGYFIQRNGQAAAHYVRKCELVGHDDAPNIMGKGKAISMALRF